MSLTRYCNSHKNVTFAFTILFISVTCCAHETGILLMIFQEMEVEYKRSVKQSILDYVLLDPAEQRRLGLHMPLPVSAIIIFCVNFVISYEQYLKQNNNIYRI